MTKEVKRKTPPVETDVDEDLVTYVGRWACTCVDSLPGEGTSRQSLKRQEWNH